MPVIQLPVGQLQANCYLLVEESTHIAVIVDPGDDAELIMQTIGSVGSPIQPLAIVATHGHFDHVMAALELHLGYDIPFYMHKKDQFLLDRMEETVQHFLGAHMIVPPAPKKVTYFEKGKVSLGSWEFAIIPTPGHTPGSVSLYGEKEKIVFVGDVIFAGGGYGRTDFAYCSKKDLETSIQTLLRLPDETVVYPGHGESTTIGRERAFYT